MEDFHGLFNGAAFVAAGGLVVFLKQPPLDLTGDEEPFRSMVLPPRKVEGTTYMDGGSVALSSGGLRFHLAIQVVGNLKRRFQSGGLPDCWL